MASRSATSPVPPRTLDAQYPASAIVDRARRAGFPSGMPRVMSWHARGNRRWPDRHRGRWGRDAVGRSAPGRGSYLGGVPGMVASPDGRRLYALGLGAALRRGGSVDRGLGLRRRDAGTPGPLKKPRAFRRPWRFPPTGASSTRPALPASTSKAARTRGRLRSPSTTPPTVPSRVIYGAIAPGHPGHTFPTWPLGRGDRLTRQS